MLQMQTTRLNLIFAMVLLTTSTQATDLTQYLWQNRLLLMVAPIATTPMFLDARKTLDQRWDAIQDRDIIVFCLFSNEGTRANDNTPLTQDEVTQLRRRYALTDSATTMILIGKDGGEKMRQPLDGDLSAVFAEIDTMLMRQQEMRDKRRRGERVTPP